MKSKENSNVLIGIDIGTTKICAIVGEANPDNGIDIRGVGLSPSHGLRKGIVVDIEKTVASIASAVQKAETMSGVQINSTFVGLAGGHITSLNSKGVVAISGKDHIITPADRDRVLEAARIVVIPPNREIIHVIPREFVVDGQGGVLEPVGMAALRLEVETHIVTGAVTSIQNIVQCVHLAGIEVEDIVLESIASSKSVLQEEEKELGVILLDIGGGTTDLAIFINGSIWHTHVLPVGGNHVTHDIAIGLRIPVLQAEQLKKEHGCALAELVSDLDLLEVRSVGQKPRPILRRKLAEIAEPRVRELLLLIKDEIVRSGQLQLLPGGVVLTGGGSQLEGIVELASSVLDLPVRVGYPGRVTGLVDIIDSPLYATAVGLLLYGSESRKQRRPLKTGSLYLFNELVGKVKSWFQEFF